jgi:hypothetical protein
VLFLSQHPGGGQDESLLDYVGWYSNSSSNPHPFDDAAGGKTGDADSPLHRQGSAGAVLASCAKTRHAAGVTVIMQKAHPALLFRAGPLSSTKALHRRLDA